MSLASYQLLHPASRTLAKTRGHFRMIMHDWMQTEPPQRSSVCSQMATDFVDSAAAPQERGAGLSKPRNRPTLGQRKSSHLRRTYVREHNGEVIKRRAAMPKTNVFVSFDYDNDKTLKDFIIGQARLPDSPFQVSDHSLKEAAPQRDWEAKARAAISRADQFVVMLGPMTRYASGGRKVVAMAQSLVKSWFQINVYRTG